MTPNDVQFITVVGAIGAVTSGTAAKAWRVAAQ